MMNCMKPGYSPVNVSSVHDRSAIKFTSEVLGAAESVTRLLTFGYIPNFRNKRKINIENFTCDLANNKSVLKDMNFVINKVMKWKTAGIISECQTKPLCINPLTLASKLSTESGEVKQRVCLDMSRTLNKLVLDAHVKLDSIKDLSFILPDQAFMTSTDFRSIF